jgi:hypothetical protein
MVASDAIDVMVYVRWGTGRSVWISSKVKMLHNEHDCTSTLRSSLLTTSPPTKEDRGRLREMVYVQHFMVLQGHPLSLLEDGRKHMRQFDHICPAFGTT